MPRVAVRLLVASVFILGLCHVPAPAQSELVIVKEGEKEFHRPGCDRIKDAKNVLALTRAQANGRGLRAHAACDNPSGSSREEPVKPERVYVDDGRYYHKKDCAKLGKERKEQSLDEAGKKFWPCPACKPPIRKRGGKGLLAYLASSSATMTMAIRTAELQSENLPTVEAIQSSQPTSPAVRGPAEP